MRKRSASSAAVFAIAAVVAIPSTSFGEVAVGGEFQVNTYTTGSQGEVAVAMNSAGDFVVVWRSFGQDGSPSTASIVGRRYDSSGAALAAEIQINAYTSGPQFDPAVAIADNGDFVVVWTDSTRDGDLYGVFARRFDSSGTPQATEIQVNVDTVGAQHQPDVAMRSGGGFIVVWTSDDGAYPSFPRARLFSAPVSPFGSEFRVSTHTATNQSQPAIATNDVGDFVVAWRSYSDTSSYDVVARRFSLFGAANGTEFVVNSYTPGLQARPDIGMEADGDFLIVWQYNQGGGSSGIFGRRFDSSGSTTGIEVQISAATGFHEYPAVTVRGNGAFVVSWDSNHNDGSGVGVAARRVGVPGLVLGPELLVNTYSTNFQTQSSLASDANGNFVVAWASGEQDGPGFGIFAQRFQSSLASIDVDGDGAAAALTDGLLMLRWLFGFRGNALVANAVNLDGCTRCAAPAIEAYLDAIF